MKLPILSALFFSRFASAHDILTLVNSKLPQLVSTYKELHLHSQLSHWEKQTFVLNLMGQ